MTRSMTDHELILDRAGRDEIRARLAAYVHDPADSDLTELLAQDAARLLADLETMLHRVDHAAGHLDSMISTAREVAMWLDGRVHIAQDPR
jgi:hypothetical protein